MKIIIFAGGRGKRFWPLSTETNPKQFVNVVGKYSTFQMSIRRIQPIYGWHSMYISTNEKYIKDIKEQCPEISINNIFAEPARRDVGPAAALALIRLKKLGVKEPIAIFWADHLIKNEKKFQEVLKGSEELILKKKKKVVIIGEKAKFANMDFGWIKVGNKISESLYEFKDFVYKPEKKRAEQMYKSENYLWNTAYLVSTVDYLLSIYKKYNPDLYQKILKIEKAIDTPDETNVIEKVYPTIDPIHFDHAVVYNIPKKDVGIIKSDMGWEDPGTLYALKKYLEPKENKNATTGKVCTYKSKDCLIFNYEKNKLAAGVKLEGMIIINTKKNLLIIPKDEVRELSEFVEKFQNGKYKKYF